MQQPFLAGLTEDSPATTGRYLVLFGEISSETVVQTLDKIAGLKAISTAKAPEGILTEADVAGRDAAVFDRLGVAVVSGTPDQIKILRREAESGVKILAVEPERFVYPAVVIQPFEPRHTGPEDPNHALSYLRGYRDAVNHLADRLTHLITVPARMGREAVAKKWDEAQATWGLQITRVIESRFSGEGVKVAILDTGLDLTHPEFSGRTIVSQSFVTGEEVQDKHGHGTHTVGTACGTRRSDIVPRYGIAYNAEIYVGKVLSNQGRGTDGTILAGIEWAVNNQCRVVSMSLGARVMPGEPYSQAFEKSAKRALAAGTLLVAAAGNDSQRPETVMPVSHPANCPSIMAVAAIDPEEAVAWFSNAGLNPDGGQIDLSAPGVDVYSSWPVPGAHRGLSGTSMATPHVAGIAALFAQATGGRGAELWTALVQAARRLPLPSVDVGSGLVQAPR